MPSNLVQSTSMVPQRLGQKTLQFGNGPWANTLLYTCPSDGSVSCVIVKSLRLCNLRSQATTVTWGIAPSGATGEVNDYKFLSGASIAANDAFDESNLYQILSPGDSVYAYGGASGGVAATLCGLIVT